MTPTMFQETQSHALLEALSQQPYDLTASGALECDGRVHKYFCTAELLALYYSNQRIDDRVLDALQGLADECDLVGQFLLMKKGAVMNSIRGVASEKRQVLHTACRDIFSSSPHEPEAVRLALRELSKLEEFLAGLESGAIVNEAGQQFDTMIHIGIGGSDLGPRSIVEALRPFGKKARQVFFISNVDPDDAAAVLQRVDLNRCLVNIVSKSGTTLETLTNESLVHKAFHDKGLDPSRHFLAVTGQGSPMDDPAKYLRSFYIFDNIGGRYSSTSMVGAVMLGFFLGYEQVIDFLRGAASLDYAAEERNIRKNPALLLALLGVWNHSYLGMATLAVLPYSQGLHRFPAHLQQCDMESNGKSTSRRGTVVWYQTGPVVWGEPGTNGQHAFYQLLHQGTEVVPCEFIGFRSNQYGLDERIEGTTSQQKLLANMLAQSVALASGQKSDNPNRCFPGNRPSSVILADKLTPMTMGALLALYEAKIVFQGFAWDINSFDQEGVQLGKVLATRFLDTIKNPNSDEKSIEKMLLHITEIV